MGIEIAIVWIMFAFFIAGYARDLGWSYAKYLLLGLFFSPLCSVLTLLSHGMNKEYLKYHKDDTGVYEDHTPLGKSQGDFTKDKGKVTDFDAWKKSHS
jgi:hypothetical protein